MKGDGGAAVGRGSGDVGGLEHLTHHPAGTVGGQLDVADVAVIHDDRVEDDLGAEHLDVPLDCGTCVAHAVVGTCPCGGDAYLPVAWPGGVCSSTRVVDIIAATPG